MKLVLYRNSWDTKVMLMRIGAAHALVKQTHESKKAAPGGRAAARKHLFNRRCFSVTME